MSRRSAPCCISRRTSSRRSRACCWSRRCPGHFATLLRATVRTMLPEHDVYITDWHNVRDVPVGRPFGFDDYVAHLIEFLEVLGAGRAHHRGLPALRRRAGRRRRHGAERQSRRSRAA